MQKNTFTIQMYSFTKKKLQKYKTPFNNKVNRNFV